MRRKSFAWMVSLLLTLSLAACGEPQLTLVAPSEGLENIQSGGAAAVTPEALREPIALPTPSVVSQVEDPSELELDGGLTWMWQNAIPSPQTLTAFDTMCAAVIGKDAAGADCLYAGQVYEFGQTPLYVAKQPYPNIGSISGGKFSIYFIEHGDAGWRLMHLPLDSSPDQAMEVDAGQGLLPVLNSQGEYLVYAAQEGQEYQIRIWEKQPQQEGAPLKAAGTIPLPGAPLEPERTYAYYPEVGLTYTLQDAQGYTIVTARPGGDGEQVRVSQRPSLAQQMPWGLYWLNEQGDLYCFDAQQQRLWQLGEDVRWYRPDALGTACLLADQGGTRVQYAALMGEEMQAITLAQGSWTYLDGALYSSGERYACALREWEGESQFAGIELALAREE